MGREDRDTHVREVESVAESNESQGDNVMADKLLEILARLLHAEEKNDGLLSPVGSLEKVIELEHSVVGAVGKVLVHAVGVEVPDRGALHHVHAEWTEEREVDCGVDLLHESCLLALIETGLASQWSEDLLHDELASERQHNGVEGDERNIPGTLAIVGVTSGIVELGRKLVCEENEVVKRVRRRRVDGVSQQGDGNQNGGKDECVLDHGLPKRRKDARLSPPGWFNLAIGHGSVRGCLAG